MHYSLLFYSCNVFIAYSKPKRQKTKLWASAGFLETSTRCFLYRFQIQDKTSGEIDYAQQEIGQECWCQQHNFLGLIASRRPKNKHCTKDGTSEAQDIGLPRRRHKKLIFVVRKGRFCASKFAHCRTTQVWTASGQQGRSLCSQRLLAGVNFSSVLTLDIGYHWVNASWLNFWSLVATYPDIAVT